MRLFIDGAIFELPVQRGIWRYFYEVLSRLGNQIDVTIWVKNPARSQLPSNCTVMGPDAGYAPRRRDLLNRLRQPWVWRKARWAIEQCDLFHSTFFTVAPVDGIKQVITVYDMIPERFPHLYYFPGADQQIQDKRRAIEAARACMVISEYSANELRLFYPQVANRIRPIYLGADHLVQAAATENGSTAPRWDRSYVLFVGDRLAYKNFQPALEAVAQSEWPASVDLVIVGAPFGESEKLLIRRLQLESRVVHAGRVSDRELRTLYRHALCFLFPSLSEGFGLPLLEAQSLECPVICSDIPVFHETGGDSVVFCDTRRAEAIAEAVARLCGDDAARQKLIQRGVQNVGRFKWDDCARQTLEVYRQAAQ